MRRLLNRLLPTLVLLLGLVLVLDACTTRRGRNNSDDDDTTSDDDDSAGDDDDSTQGDDDDTGDDDDSTQGDDDDGGSPGILDLSADQTSFGAVSIGSQASTTVYFENLGGTAITANVSLSDLSGTWILQGGAVVTIAPFDTQTRTLLFQPSTASTFSLSLEAAHDGANSSPQQLIFSGSGTGGGGGTETSCTDGTDNDGDTLIDCDDPDCANDPACQSSGTDPCCAPNPQFQNGACSNSSMEQCACTNDSFCCTDWDQVCVDVYDGSHCGGGTLCGP